MNERKEAVAMNGINHSIDQSINRYVSLETTIRSGWMDMKVYESNSFLNAQ